MIHFIHKLFKLESISSRFFFWLFMLIVFTSCLYLIIFLTIDKNERLHDAKEKLNHELLNQQIIIENWASERLEETRMFADFPVTRELQLDVMARRFKYYYEFSNQIDSIVYINSEGFVNIDTATEEIIITDSEISLKDRDYFIAAEQGKESIHDIVESRASGKPTIIFSVPVFSADNVFEGVIFSAINLSSINQLLSETIRGDTNSLILINNKGEIITHLTHNIKEITPLVTSGHKISNDKTALMLNGSNKLYEFVEDDCREMIGSFVPLFDGEYYLINEISKSEILSVHYRIVKLMVIATFVIIVTGFLLTFPVSRLLLKPFYYLVDG